jgi:hypothetical protein
MHALVLALSLAGLLPGPALMRGAPATDLADPMERAAARSPSATLHLDSLHVEVDLDASGSQLDEIGRTLGNGIAIAGLRIGLDGQPATPFVSNFLHAHEIRFLRIDPDAVASSVMLQVRITLE